MALNSALPARPQHAFAQAARAQESVDIVLQRRSGHLIVTPDAGIGADAIHAFLAALAGCVKSPLVIDLTHVLATDAALLAVYEALHGSAAPTCEVRLVTERLTARRRIGRFLGHRGVSVYTSVDSAIGAG